VQALINQFKKFVQRVVSVVQAIAKTTGKRFRQEFAPRRSPARRSSPSPAKLDWVIPGKLSVGGLPQEKDINILTRSKIQVILSLCAPSEGELPPEIEQGFHCVRLILPDSRYTSDLTAERLCKAVDILRQCDRKGLPLYVHCLAGIERSPTVCIAYLCCVHHLELWEAVELVKRIRPAASPSRHQIQVIYKLMQTTHGQTQ
jgi:atypical dual specificity phosphatase